MDVREKLVELPIEDALLVLREEHRQRTDSYTTYLEHGGKGDPAEEVSLDALAMAISALEKTKWISVKDRLPEDYKQRVMVICIGDYPIGYPKIDTDRYVRGHWVRYGIYVTHWMPLPEPPKGE